MVELLFRPEVEANGGEGTRGNSPFPAPSILRPPAPPSISATGKFSLTYDDRVNITHQFRRDLSENARQALGRWCEADYIEVNDAVMCTIDSGDEVHYCQVGETMDRIAMRHGEAVGRRIFDLLDKCPLAIYTPQRQITECHEWAGWNDEDERVIEYPEKTIGSLYPRWSWADKKDWFTRKRRRPKRRPKLMPVPSDLRNLIDACETVEPVETGWIYEPGEVAPFPYATINWGNGPWVPDWIKHHCGDYSTRPDHEGSDPSWIHLLPAYRNGQEEGAVVFTPCPPCHTEDGLMQLLQSAKPYMKLLDYITDERTKW